MFSFRLHLVIYDSVSERKLKWIWEMGKEEGVLKGTYPRQELEGAGIRTNVIASKPGEASSLPALEPS